MNCDAVVNNICFELKEYIESNGIKSLILGVSGGIDSALCAVLARPVCKILGIPLIGRSLPIESNKPEEIDRAMRVGNAFCTEFREFDLTPSYNAFLMNLREEALPGEFDEFEHKVRQGNIKARTRMIYLYDLAQRHKGMTLSTDNLTELMLGFWTLHGDVGDYGMIQKLWKTELYELAEFLWGHHAKMSDPLNGNRAACLRLCIDAVPTDGLGVTDSDFDQIKAKDYVEVDRILKTWLCMDIDSFNWDRFLMYEGRPKEYKDFVAARAALKDHPVVQRHIKSGFKRLNPYNIPRARIDGMFSGCEIIAGRKTVWTN